MNKPVIEENCCGVAEVADGLLGSMGGIAIRIREDHMILIEATDQPVVSRFDLGGLLGFRRLTQDRMVPRVIPHSPPTVPPASQLSTSELRHFEWISDFFFDQRPNAIDKLSPSEIGGSFQSTYGLVTQDFAVKLQTEVAACFDYLPPIWLPCVDHARAYEQSRRDLELFQDG